MSAWDDLWITDENVLAECGGDYPEIVPLHQRVIQGADGVFTANSFAFTAASIPSFTATGIAPGHVLTTKAKAGTGAAVATDCLIVSTVATSSLAVRRLNMLDGQGVPPGGTAGTTGLAYFAGTCLPQIRENQRRIVLAFRLVPADVLNPGDFTEALVCHVLADLYGALFRGGANPTTGSGGTDNFAAKAKQYRSRGADLLKVLQAQYGPIGQIGRRPVIGQIQDRPAVREETRRLRNLDSYESSGRGW